MTCKEKIKELWDATLFVIVYVLEHGDFINFLLLSIGLTVLIFTALLIPYIAVLLIICKPVIGCISLISIGFTVVAIISAVKTIFKIEIERDKTAKESKKYV